MISAMTHKKGERDRVCECVCVNSYMVVYKSLLKQRFEQRPECSQEESLVGP